MNLLHSLFDQFSRGTLDQKYLPQLQDELTEAYFSHPEQLSEEENLFAEELIIKAYQNHQLEDKYKLKWAEAISGNKSLSRKILLFGEIEESSVKANRQRIQAATGKLNPETEKQEEEELQKILNEVIEKVHAEEKSGSVADQLQLLWMKIRKFLPDVSFAPAQTWKLALVTAGLIIIAVVVWISIRPGDQPMITDKGTVDTSFKEKTRQEDSLGNKLMPYVPERPDNKQTKLAENETPTRKRIRGREIEPGRTLLACAENIPEQMDYVAVRSSSNDAEDMLASASELYLQAEYGSCLLILDALIEGQYFKSTDTLEQIRYFSGILHFSQGVKKQDLNSLERAVQVLGTIAETSVYYHDARWYQALSLISLGRKQEGKSILQSLINLNQGRSAEAKELHELLNK